MTPSSSRPAPSALNFNCSSFTVLQPKHTSTTILNFVRKLSVTCQPVVKQPSPDMRIVVISEKYHIRETGHADEQNNCGNANPDTAAADGRGCCPACTGTGFALPSP